MHVYVAVVTACMHVCSGCHRARSVKALGERSSKLLDVDSIADWIVGLLASQSDTGMDHVASSFMQGERHRR